MYHDIALDFPIGSIREWLRHAFFNMGGPRSRMLKETIRSTILGNPSSGISWPQKTTVGLNFPEDADPVEILNCHLEKKGWADPDEAKGIYRMPSGILYCCTLNGSGLFPDVLTADTDEIIRAALILCLCNRHFYDPGRSAILTSNRLKRKVCLYGAGDFYADN